MKSFFLKNPLLKVLSLALAMVLWFFVREEQPEKREVTVQTVVRNLPEQLILTEDTEPEIRLQIVGPRMRMRDLNEKKIEPFVLNLSGARRGVNAFPVHEDDFRIPMGTRVTRIFPQVLRVTLEPAEERLVKVEPRFVGDPVEGFEVSKYVVNPPYLKVRAAKSELSNLSAVFTVPINLDGRSAPFNGEFNVRGYNPQWGVDDKKVLVHVDIRKK